MKIVLLGYKPQNFDNIKMSTELLAQGIYDGFKKLNVEIIPLTITSHKHYMKELDNVITSDMMNADCIVAITYWKEQPGFIELKNKINAKKLITIRECPFPEADYGFIFNPDSYTANKNMRIVHIPCFKNLLTYTEKEPNSILIDHFWQDYLGTELDWTEKIEFLLQDESKYKCYRMLRWRGEENFVKPFETPIPLSPYLKYLENTKHIENFIITHKEGFPYGVIDMAVRGTRIFTPPNFIPQILIDTFNIKVFKSKSELINQLNEPIDIERKKNYINKCISFDELAEIAYEKIQTWM